MWVNYTTLRKKSYQTRKIYKDESMAPISFGFHDDLSINFQNSFTGGLSRAVSGLDMTGEEESPRYVTKSSISKHVR